MSEFWSALVPIAQFIGAFTAIAAIATFYWSNVRLPARRLGIVDFATKQVAFWKQALELELSVTTDTVQQQDAKDRTYAAMQRVRAHADSELEYLSWPAKTEQQVFKSVKSLLNTHAPASLRGWKKLEWYTLKFLCWLLFIVATMCLVLVLAYSVVFPRPVPPHNLDNLVHMVLAQLFGVACIIPVLLVLDKI